MNTELIAIPQFTIRSGFTLKLLEIGRKIVPTGIYASEGWIKSWKRWGEHCPLCALVITILDDLVYVCRLPVGTHLCVMLLRQIRTSTKDSRSFDIAHDASRISVDIHIEHRYRHPFPVLQCPKCRAGDPLHLSWSPCAQYWHWPSSHGVRKSSDLYKPCVKEVFPTAEFPERITSTRSILIKVKRP